MTDEERQRLIRDFKEHSAAFTQPSISLDERIRLQKLGEESDLADDELLPELSRVFEQSLGAVLLRQSRNLQKGIIVDKAGAAGVSPREYLMEVRTLLDDMLTGPGMNA